MAIVSLSNHIENTMTKLGKIFKVLNEKGVGYAFKKVMAKLNPERIPDLESVQHLFANTSGLEIGGPSGLFRNDGFVPISKVINGLDGCNFSNTTLWEGTIKSGENYLYHKDKTGSCTIMFLM